MTGQPDLHSVDWSKIPAPEDDGGAQNLTGTFLPKASLPSTKGPAVDLSTLGGRCIVFAYPMTGRPGVPLPPGWDFIPGARGCTPQACAFRDIAQELHSAGARHIFGLSAQDTAYQLEAANRLHLPFPLLSDQDLAFSRAAGLPAFEVDGKILLKRLTMVVDQGRITRVFYPVFPPDRSARDVLDWLEANPP